MNKAAQAALNELVDLIVAEHGGRVSVQNVARTIADGHPDTFRSAAWGGFVGQVRSAMTRSEQVAGTPLPRMVSIDSQGTYVQRRLLDVDEYRVGIERYARQSRESLAKAYAMARECQEVYGVWIDPAERKAS